MDDFELKLKSRAAGRVGTLLRGKWRIERVLGSGGMATVFEATHRNGKRGAVKMLHRELSVDPGIRARFLREGYVANQVDHPGAVSVLDDDHDDDGCVFLVMELLEGENLEALARSRPGYRFEVGEVLAMAERLLDTLAAAHDKGIVHRDLKPENLFLTKRTEIKVLDFGIAHMRDGAGGTSRETKAGSQMGTPAFMPPEQALGNWEAVTAQSDLWAVGATMFALLTGRTVHSGGSVNQLLLAAMTKPAPKLASVLPEVPAEVAAVVDRALEHEAKDRWEDARTMQREVRQVRATLGLDQVELRLPPSPAPEPADVPAPSVQAAPAPVAVEEPKTVVDAAQPAAPAVDDVGADAERVSSPMRTAPALATEPPHVPEASKRRLVFGVAIAGLAVLGAALATLAVSSGRGGSPSQGEAQPTETPSASAATAEPAPTVEPVGLASASPDDSAGVAPAGSASAGDSSTTRPSSPRPAAKPKGTGDPFNRWR